MVEKTPVFCERQRHFVAHVTVVEAYAAGKIELEKPTMKRGGASSIRYAPWFQKADERFTGDKSFPYNAEHNVKGWRLAPSFRATPTKQFDFSDPKIKPYNAESIARFLTGAKHPAKGFRRG
jgi:hypothetical protein